MKPLRQWSVLRVTAVCAVWILFSFFAFRWWIGPWWLRGAYDAAIEYARTHPERIGGGGVGAVSAGVSELFLFVTLVPMIALLVVWLLLRYTRH
jgi:hypothetical protein